MGECDSSVKRKVTSVQKLSKDWSVPKFNCKGSVEQVRVEAEGREEEEVSCIHGRGINLTASSIPEEVIGQSEHGPQ